MYPLHARSLRAIQAPGL